MTLRLLTTCFCSLWVFMLNAQHPDFSFLTIPKSLKENANSVVRLEQEYIQIKRQDELTRVTKRVVTVLNENGNRHTDAVVYYDDETKVKNLQAIVYNSFGKEIAKFKKRDFRDVSAADGFSLFTDSRVLFLDYTPVAYPYTMVFEAEIETSNTAFIPKWYAGAAYHNSIEKSEYTIEVASELGFRYDVKDTAGVFTIEKIPSGLSVKASNIPARARESYSPGIDHIVPSITFSIDNFHLEGVDGSAKNWKEFGKWMDQELLSETRDLSMATKEKVRAMTQGMTSNTEKARKIYEFVQEKTRYISVQIGIGGWKPMLASEVDKLGYGDCKALTNYTKSLLEAVDIPSYYTVLHSSDDKRSFPADFVSFQGNHAILAIPEGEELIWLECTSQDIPFGFMGAGNDDRDVLIITPEGGDIVHTVAYDDEQNEKTLVGNYTISPEGSIEAQVEMVSTGVEYDKRYRIAKESEVDQRDHYYDYWSYLNNMSIKSIAHENDKDAISFKEHLTLSVQKYASFVGEDMLLSLNALDRFVTVPRKDSNRAYPIDIDRGYMKQDRITVHLPHGYQLSQLPEAIHLETPYGTYTTTVTKNDDHTLLYVRKLKCHSGTFPKEEYTAFRTFLKRVAQYDKQKVILKKI